MSNWTAEKVVIGETEFIFEKALAMEAFRLFESLRPALTSVSDTLQKAEQRRQKKEDPQAIAMTALIEIAGTLPQESVQNAMTHLSQHIFFRRGSNPKQKVATDLDSAFAGLSTVRIYEILIRAFLVNFQTSFVDLQLLQAGLMPAKDTEKPKT